MVPLACNQSISVCGDCPRGTVLHATGPPYGCERRSRSRCSGSCSGHGSECRAGCPIRWLHIPKCGSTFRETVFSYGCNPTAGPDGRPDCPRMLSLDTGHLPLELKDLGHAVANFRHPRSRMASFCRRGDGHELRKRNDFLRCNAETVLHSHFGVMTRLILGQRLPGVGNGVEPLAPLASGSAAVGRRLRDALVRLHNDFAFVGITEAWTE
jgi:hypothetical protein